MAADDTDQPENRHRQRYQVSAIVILRGLRVICRCVLVVELRSATKKWRQTRLNVVKAVAL